MKKLLYILFTISLLSACSSDDETQIEPKQDYTSFYVIYKDKGTVENVVVGYYDSDGKCKKIAELGNLEPNVASKEVRVSDEIKSVWIFSDVPSPSYKTNHEFVLDKNKKNELYLNSDFTGTFVEKESDQYPH